jgi:hypothetical protein
MDSFSPLVPAARPITAISGSQRNIALHKSGASRDSFLRASSFVITHFTVFAPIFPAFASSKTLSAFFPI